MKKKSCCFFKVPSDLCIQRLKTILEAIAIIDIDSSDVGGASWWVELVGGWGWP